MCSHTHTYTHSPAALHFNIPLWYSSLHKSLEIIQNSHPYLTVTKKLSEIVRQPTSCAVLSVSLQTWDYTQHARTQCLRLNVGVVVTPQEEGPCVLHSLSAVHPRPGPLSPSTPMDADMCRTLANTLSPNRYIVSYTAVVPVGQDPSSVFVGWTVAQFQFIESQFQSELWTGDVCRGVLGQTVQIMDEDSQEFRSRSMSCPVSTSNTGGMAYSHSSAYLVCLKQLLTGSTEANLSSSLR